MRQVAGLNGHRRASLQTTAICGSPPQASKLTSTTAFLASPQPDPARSRLMRISKADAHNNVRDTSPRSNSALTLSDLRKHVTNLRDVTKFVVVSR